MNSSTSRSALSQAFNNLPTPKSHQRFHRSTAFPSFERRGWVRNTTEVVKKSTLPIETRVDGIPEWAPAQSLAKGRPTAFDDDGLYESWQGVSW